mgnify:CR=1 FL=1
MLINDEKLRKIFDISFIIQVGLLVFFSLLNILNGFGLNVSILLNPTIIVISLFIPTLFMVSVYIYQIIYIVSNNDTEELDKNEEIMREENEEISVKEDDIKPMNIIEDEIKITSKELQDLADSCKILDAYGVHYSIDIRRKEIHATINMGMYTRMSVSDKLKDNILYHIDGTDITLVKHNKDINVQ